MGPFQPGEQVHVVVVEDLPTYDLDDNDRPTNHRTELTVYVAVATVLLGGRSVQLADDRTLHLREGFVFRYANQATEAAFDISRRIKAGEPLYPF